MTSALSPTAATQGRINHCAGCTMGGGPRRKGGGGDQLPNFCFDVWTFRNHNFRVGLNVTTTKKVLNFLFGGKQSAPLRKSWLRTWQKGSRLTLVWGPRVVNAALRLPPSPIMSWQDVCRRTYTHNTFGDRSFTAARPQVWNNRQVWNNLPFQPRQDNPNHKWQHFC